MRVAVIKAGVFIGGYSVPDGDSVVILADDQNPPKFSLYDGVLFRDNPEAANLIALDKKKSDIQRSVAEAATEADLDAVLQNAVNPSPVPPIP